jgi:hypothetical protein
VSEDGVVDGDGDGGGTSVFGDGTSVFGDGTFGFTAAG